MRPSMNVRGSMETDQAPSPTKRTSMVPYVAGCVGLGLVALAFLLAYRGYTTKMDAEINSVSETCSDGDRGVELFKNPPVTTLKVWTFNITNPFEYVNGETAALYELGPYGIKVDQKRKHVDFSESQGTVTYDMYNDMTFKSKASCPDCNQDDVINGANFAYLKMIGSVQNEANLLISSTCSPVQVQNIKDTTGTKSYCEASEMGKTVDCICCASVPTTNATTCSDIASATSKAGGLHSWLAKYDNGFQLNSVSSAFPLSTGAYTPLVRRMGVTELFFGTVSAQLGMLTTAQGMQSGDTSILYANANTTADLKDACYALSCPQLSDVVAAAGTQGLAAIAGVECTGTVPSYEVLMSDGGLSEERAKQLRYMEGSSCRPFGVTIAIAAVLSLDANAVKICGDGSTLTSEPCCLKTFQSNVFDIKGSGVGCHQWVNGLLTNRRVYSMDEAYQYILPSPETQAYTGCAHGDLKFKQIMSRGATSYKDWFIPTTYTYPNMPWADPAVVTNALKGLYPGTMTIFNVTGFLPAIREGRGITSKFLEYQLTDGDPKYDEELLWSTYQMNTLLVEFDKNHLHRGIEVNRFLPEITAGTTPEEKEAEQRSGQMPYANMENLVYASDGGPIIMSFPLFYSTDNAILTQSVNTERGTTSQVGVNIYRTRDSYSKSSKELDTPELVTNATWDKYGTSEYRGYLNVEPATGVALSGSVVNQLSTFTWNCNPQIDPTCAFKATALDAGNPMCYIQGGTMYPCSAANVFTPRVMGAKVLPLYWVHSKPEAPAYVSQVLLGSINTRYALAILVIVVPTLALFGIVFLLTQAIKISQMESEQKDVLRSLSRFSMGAKPADAVFAPADLHKRAQVENDIM